MADSIRHRIGKLPARSSQYRHGNTHCKARGQLKRLNVFDPRGGRFECAEFLGCFTGLRTVTAVGEKGCEFSPQNKMEVAVRESLYLRWINQALVAKRC